ncbi:MAG: hypothetical protein ACOVP8_08815 [Phycisphaerales bacterium]|jgi:hypothetical protein
MSTDPRVFIDNLHEICEQAEERFPNLTVCIRLPVKGQKKNNVRFSILVDHPHRGEFTRRVYIGEPDVTIIKSAVDVVCIEHVQKLDRH